MDKVKCRSCGKDIDKNKEQWISPINRRYYHEKCWDRLNFYLNNTNEVVKPVSDVDFQELSYLFLERKVRMQINYAMFYKQWNALIDKGYKEKGMYLALRYFYDYLNGSPDKSKGGIGIIDSVYNDAKDYFNKKYNLIAEQTNKLVKMYNNLQKENNSKIIKRKPEKVKRPPYELIGEDDSID